VVAGGVAAALLALFAAVPFVTGGDNSGGDEQAATAALDAAGGEFLGDLGDLSDPSSLRQRLGAQRSVALESAKTARGSDAAGDGSGTAEAPEAFSSPAVPAPAAGGPAVPAASAPQPASDTAAQPSAQLNQGAGGDVDAAGLDRTVADACARILARGAAPGSQLLAVATGTYEGTPAVVAVFDGEGGTTAYVAARDGCRLLTRYQI
ncbi:MAG: hypothetical protein M3357_12490, partial [Actinomycetota bacterium]|nr:hypothetical protein [Actinomycetota bacterium]